MAAEAYVKILLDESGELVGAEREGIFYPAEVVTKHKVPRKVKEGWSVKVMTVWHNSPCCVQLGDRQICWPPCV